MASNYTKCLVWGKGSPLIATATTRPTTIEPTEVMIRIKAIAINPADCKMIDQGHRVTEWPFVPGLDGAGVVEAVGDKVNNFASGDRVTALFAPGDRGGSYQDLAVVQETRVAKIPTAWSFEDAATLAVCYYTGIAALGIGLQSSLPFVGDGPLTDFKPSSVLVLGGSSALSAAVIQLLHLALPDCRILATSSPKHHDHITNNLGADKAFDRNSTSLVADVKVASPSSRGVDAIIDAVGAGATERYIFETFDPDGPRRYAQVWTGDAEIQVPSGVNSMLFRSRDVPQLQGADNMMQALQTLLEQGKYKLPLPVQNVGNGLGALERGLELMRKGVSGEKLVVTV
ncbi:Dehydrogenase orsE [Cladobotryum mycophilum]|uniref:Dehydrogenase orsE n=1 Tax=Cladobotryum mycophilum TaxID=491253 RepID=A0ABR0SN02_9HYPO